MKTIVINKPERKIQDQHYMHSDILKIILENLREVDFSILVGIDKDELKRKHFIIVTVELVLEVASNLNYPIRIMNNSIYVFNGAFWKKFEERVIKRFLAMAALKLGVNKYYADHHEFRIELIKQLYEFAALMNTTNSDELKINLRNGTYVFLNEKENLLKPFSAEDSFTYQLPFEYNKDAECPKFMEFLNKVLPDKEQQNILGEYLGYVFIKHSKLKLEKCMVLYGSGANGKSVVYDVISALLGSHNISNYSLQALTNTSGYYRALLAGKLLNYGSEISAHMDPELFKQLVSGESVGARLPYHEPFELTDYAKLMFNANSLPNDVDQNDAFFRRFLIIHFAITIPEEERDPEFAKKITDKELPGVFNWILAGLNRLMEQKNFTYSDAVISQVKEYKEISDSVALFLQDENYKKSDERVMTLKAFNDEYRKYSLSSGYKPITRNELSRRLRKFGFTIARRNSGFVVEVEKRV